MKNIVIFTALAAWLVFPAITLASAHAADAVSAASEQPPKKQRKNKKPRPPMPVTPGSQVIMFKNNSKAEIRPDKSVWWFGVNYKKALVADGTHELKDGQKIKTLGGKLVGKMPRPDPKLQPKQTLAR